MNARMEYTAEGWSGMIDARHLSDISVDDLNGPDEIFICIADPPSMPYGLVLNRAAALLLAEQILTMVPSTDADR